jgi:hypothetical protein
MALGSLGEIIVGLRTAVTQFTPVSFFARSSYKKASS